MVLEYDVELSHLQKASKGGAAMNSQTRREIRSGLIALAVSGLWFTLGIVLRGEVDLADPTSFLRAAASPYYIPGWAMILVGGVLQLYGFFGLYRYLTYRAESLIALLAFLLRIVGLALGLPLFTFLTINVPVIAKLYQQGNPEALAVLEANFTGTGIVLLGTGAMAAIIGFILFAIAMWRDDRLPKWTVILFVLSLPLLAAAVTFITELLGAVLLLISTGTIAWKGWQESEARRG
jgi:hypothetical protein